MSTIELKNFIQKSLETNDFNLLSRLVDVIKDYQTNNDTSILTSAQKNTLDDIRERHLNGKSKSYSWKEIKDSL